MAASVLRCADKPVSAPTENLDLPVVGSMLQKCGAFFIRRTFGEDELYPVVVRGEQSARWTVWTCLTCAAEYIEQLLSTGHNIECFIEGTRSRTGQLETMSVGIAADCVVVG